MSPWYADRLAEILESLHRAITCASDPHVDCRDEMQQHLNDADETMQRIVARTNEERHQQWEDKRNA